MHLLNGLSETRVKGTFSCSINSFPDTVGASQQDLDQLWSQNALVPEQIQGCVHDLVAEIAKSQPAAPAVSAWDGDFTYSQLDALADEVARRLVELGIKPKSSVPILFSKSRWTCVAMLGVIKAGCAAIALDTTQPDTRLRAIVEQAQPRIIVSSLTNSERATLLANVPVLELDDALLDRLDRAAERSIQPPPISPSDIVYVSFTSGTTGQPKGVCISHANVRSAVHYQGEKLGFHRGARVFDFAPYSFDVAWSNFLHTMCAGGCICIAREQDMLNDLSSAISAFDATLINVTPTVLRTIDPIPPTLQSVLLSGEMPYRENVTKWAGNVRLCNTYGPTECTWKCTFSVLTPSQEDRPDIGTATGTGFCAWVVDPSDSGRLVSKGSVGELYLEGPLVGQGYLKDPEKTALEFIVDPPWLLAGSKNFVGRTGRLYKTGDLVKYKKDGTLLFIGRKDATQLKIRGQRVEIGDVEHHVRACLVDDLPVIADAILPRDSEISLLALFVQIKGQDISKMKALMDGLAVKLLDTLPGFMIPSIYFPVEEIPVASTGKADRKRLREMAGSRSWKEIVELQSSILSTTEFYEPSNDVEQRLRDAWAKVLSLNSASISISDSFLRLGGESIAAMQLVAVARGKKLSLTVADIFRTPVLRDLAQVTKVREVSQFEHQIEPFALLAGERDKLIIRKQAAELCGASSDEVEDIYPCTPLQQGMLAMTAKNQGLQARGRESAVGYISTTTYELPHHINIEQFQNAWLATVECTAIIRTRIVDIPGEGLVQVVLNTSVPLRSYAQLTDILENDEPMGLGSPLCRAGVSHSNGSSYFVLQMHHAIFDGWCTMLILDALQAAYQEKTRPQPFALFQPFIKHVLATDNPKTATFWKEQLTGSEATVFPSQNYVSKKKFDVDHHVSGLQWPRTGITPSSIVRSALAILLALYTNSNDVKFGVTVSGRHAPVPGIEQIAGPTIATIPLRIKFEWDQTVEYLQQMIQQQAAEITEHEQYGLQRIQRLDEETEEASQFQLLLVVQPSEKGASQKAGGLFTNKKDITMQEGKRGSMDIYNSYAMMVVCELEDSGLILKINFDSGAIEQSEVQRFALQLEHLLRQLCSEALWNSNLRDIATPCRDDLTDIWQWNSVLPETIEKSVIELIDTRASTNPMAPAISAWDKEITYQQLKDLSANLANRLRQEGVGPGSIIVLNFEKSSWMAVSMITLFKIGAIALPVSVPTSTQRANEIVDSLQPMLAITSNKIESSPFDGLIPTLCISEFVGSGDEAYVHVFEPHVNLPSESALILFSSGSTGVPKSIMWTHSTLSSNIYAAITSFGLSTTSRIFQFAGYEFDVSTVESLSALAAGGCICIPSELDRTNRLAEAINNSMANWICLTPSVAEALSPRDLPTLRTIVFAGEKLQEKTAFRWAENIEFVYNWYGPAEASVSTSYNIKEVPWKHGMIGRSRSAVTWLVKPNDPNNTLAPVGAIAELCIEGPITARYVGINSLSLNQTAFFSLSWMQDGSRQTTVRQSQFYRTGDLVKYNSDGSIVFIGRSQDPQRKLRGQRVELSEIEIRVQSFLSGKLEVTVVAEIFAPSNSNNEVLALFISPAGIIDPTEDAATFIKRTLPVEDLEANLIKYLPSYMVPKLYIPIEKTPTSHSGKTDRRRLRHIGGSLTYEQLADMQPSRRKTRKPSSDAEKWLQQLWAKIIGIEAEMIYANDNFLRLGGDSITAMRLVASARNQGFQLTVADVFEAPQLEDMAKRIRQGSSQSVKEIRPFSLLSPNITELEARSHAARLCSVPEPQIVDIYPCTPLQEGLLALGARMHGQYVSRSVLGIQDGIDIDRLQRAWQATVQKLAIMRTRIIDIPRQGLMQVVLDANPCRSENDLSSYLGKDVQDTMGLGTELCRAAIIDRNFIFTIHHCTYDGNSLKMILDELECQYLEQIGIAVTPFQNFIEHIDRVKTQQAARFWKEQLQKLELRQFPLLPSPAYQPKANEELNHSISLGWPRTGITPSTIIRSAWAVLASQYVLSNDVIFGVTVSGRQADMKGIENCVGPTISTVPFAVSIDWNETVEAFLGRMQHQSIEMTPYEQYGLQNIQHAHEELNDGLIQTLLVVQPVAEGKSLDEDSLLFKARSFASNLNTRGSDPFNTYGLMVVCELSNDGFHLRMSFDNNIIDRKQISRIASQLETIIRQMCMRDIATTRLEVVQTASSDDLELFWRQNAEVPEGPDALVHDTITVAAKQQPEAIAIDAWDGQFTYKEIDELSSTLGKILIGLGVTKGSIIALCFDKSKWTHVAQLAVIKAGAVSLLQSTIVPEGRMKRVFTNLNVELALASESRVGVVSKLTRCITIDQLMNGISSRMSISLPVLTMSDPAAVLVSSGSTGEPKQVLWSHRGLAANVKGHGPFVSLNQSSRVFQFASYDFDVATIESMSALAHMACLCIPSESERTDGLAAAINHYKPTYMNITPSTSKLLIPDEVPSISTIVLSGENVVEEEVNRWKSKYHVLNWYGPCEAPATWCSADTDNWYTGVIGHINSAHPALCWLVNPNNHNRLVPFGAIGEIAVEGYTCAEGYLGNPTRTEQVFRKNPTFLTLGHGTRRPGRSGLIYRTGDLARYDTDGNLVYMGRKDAQLKIRGQLVAPEEVESNIRRCLSHLNDAQVIVDAILPDGGGGLTLVAFIRCGIEEVETMTKGLNERLKPILPRYAIPAYYIPVTSFPKTSSAKIDRTQLRQIGASFTPPQVSENNRGEPSTTAERTLRELWSIALGIDAENISLNDSFLRTGDSIQAMRLAGIARQQGLSLPVAGIFEYPILRDMAKVLKNLEDVTDDPISPFSLLNLDQDAKRARQYAASQCGVDADNIEDMFPCTPLQEGLLALTLKREGDYIGRNILNIKSSVDLIRFKEAWARVMTTIPILRTRIIDLPGQGLVQVVIREDEFWNQFKDVDEYLRMEKKLPINLGSPLVKYALLPSNATDTVRLGKTNRQPSSQFVLTIHHSLYDGVTMPLIFETLESFYNGTEPLKHRPFQSFVRYINGQDKDTETQYWAAQFSDLEAPQFPTLPSSTYQPQTNSTLTRSIDHLIWRVDDATPSTTIRAAWSMICSRYSNSADVVFGTVVSGRKALVEGIERIAGPTIATIPVRIKLDAEGSILDFIMALQTQATEMIQYEQTGLSKIRQISDEAQLACQFQTLVVIQPPDQDTNRSSLFIPDVNSKRDLYHTFTSYALVMIFTLEESGLKVEFCFDSTIIEHTTIERMAEHFEQILRQLCSQESDEIRLCDINMTTDSDLDQIWQWNAEVPEKIGKCMHHLITDVARTQPDAIAVSAWDGELTYGTLDRLSTTIAYHLVERGVHRNMIVPLCFEKSMFALIAFLGVMKAGAAGLFLDPTTPESRLRVILQQVQPTLIISSVMNKELSAKLVTNMLVLGLNSEIMKIPTSEESGHTLGELPYVDPSDLLYVVFTSGSTGIPKGCLIQHYSFCSAVYHQRSTLRLNSSSRMYDFSSYTFDAAHWSAFHVLAAGGTLCIPSEEERKSQLTDSIRRFRATDIFLTPSTARLIDPTDIPTLRQIYVGGEKVENDDVRPWMPYSNPFITYGPTECSAITLYWRVLSPMPSHFSIGKGIGVSTWIVDPLSSERLSPVGMIGELYLEGSLVGKGYLDDEEKTAASFIESPSWLLKGAPNHKIPGRDGRLYKTGDLVKYDPTDGKLIFIGRKDTQVKLRGQRIELSEIEHHVRHILSSIVESPMAIAEVIHSNATGRTILALFIQVKQTDRARFDEIMSNINSRLQEHVPSYMVPGAYIPMESIPLSISGKTDRKSLRDIGANLTLDQLNGVVDNHEIIKPPTTESELNLQKLWMQVLNTPLDKISADSSFLRLGGDSISAMQLAALARRRGLSLTVKNILKTPQLSEMAKTMINLATADGDTISPFSLLKSPKNKDATIDYISKQCNVKISQIEDIFPCTGVQKSLLSMTAKSENSYIARYLLQLKENVDIDRFKQAWKEVSETTAPILRYRIVDAPAEGLVQVQLNEPIEWDTCNSIEAYLRRDQSKLMGLSMPLTRLGIINDTETRELCCIFTQHHAIYDGHSLDLLLREVSKTYVGAVDNGPVAPFQAFIKHVRSIDQEKAREFWVREFLDFEGVPFPELADQDYHPKADSTVRRDFVDLKWADRDATASTIIRAAWSIVTARYTDTNDIVFGAMVTGRQAPISGIDRIIAPLIAAVPVRVKFDPEQSVDDLLSAIQKQSIDMIEYEHTELLDIRRINADTDRGSRFNTLIVVQPASQGSYMSHSDGPFQYQSQIRSATKDLDDFNPNAVMIMCQLIENNDLRFEISFDSRVIDVLQMERIASQFEHVLRQICASSSQRVGAIDTISAQDIAELWKWNASVPTAVHKCVHDLIDDVIARSPGEPAVCAWDGSLSYAELDNLSTRLALQLAGLGAGRGMIIPLCFEKSMWYPVAALAVMKAGAACVAMDSTQPEGRLESIVKQINPKLVLSSSTNEILASRISNNAKVVIVDRAHLVESPINLVAVTLPTVQPSDLLYVVFTSGSTGVPKGVMTTHENFASAATHQAEALNIKPGTRVYDFVSYNFDVSWSNLLQTLICGACLCIPSEWERKNDIPGSLNRMNCDYVYFTPSVARSLESSTMPGIRTLAMGGEPIQSVEVSRWTQAETVIGIYGPAECAQALSFVRLSTKTQNGYVGHSFGANTWLVQPGHPDRLAPIGAVGELLIEGPTVSKGYFGDPDKTKAAYIRDPAWLPRGAPRHLGRYGILYKTGDLLRYNSDGSLGFIGRKDGMIKLRGQRIELGEVEYHVRASLSDPGLCNDIAAEIITPQNSTSPILAVFIALSQLRGLESEDVIHARLMQVVDGLDDKLSERVPQYMIPGAYIHIDKIPMTTTNKTDRRALRELGKLQTLERLAELNTHGKERRAPSTLMEKRLQALWSSVLSIDINSISADSSFMRIGGESIAAMRLVSTAREQQLSLTVADIFRAPRLSQLAMLVKEVTTEEYPKPQLPFSLLQTNGPETFLQNFVKPVIDGDIGSVIDVVPATDFQERAILDALQDPPSRYPHWIFDLPTGVDFSRLQRACESLVKHFDILHTIFIQARGKFWQVLLSNFKPVYDNFETDTGDIKTFTDTLCAEDLQRPRILGRSFIRFMAVKHKFGQHKLVFRISHAQFDGYSWDLVLKTLSAIYSQEHLPTIPAFSQYIAFSDQKKNESLNYWTSRLQGSLFPSWGLSDSSERQYSTSDRLTMKETIEMPNMHFLDGTSPATIFHAACAIALSRQFRQTEVVFGRLVTGRSMLPSSLQNVVGPTMTEVPIRVRVETDNTISSIALKLQSQFIEDSMHEATGMVEIIRNCTEWPEEARDFGWRTSFQQEEADSFTFLGSHSKISFYERDLLPRSRPEVYATPREGKLDLEFEGNRRLISEDTAREFLARLRGLLRAD
ncbi:hypothetical protein F5884DRAFT_828155 [Xylogone sp. PMI_703]|nr:hypothetical protein F5884DRAFT_828155 [Xylogone sp. PMI_703]